MSPWQPIETAPKDDEGQILLGIMRNGKMCEAHIGGYRWAWNEDEESCWWSDQADDLLCPTHWMPLPAPPAETQDTQGEAA